METVGFLAPIASRACHLEESDPQSIGEFMKTLCICAGLDDGLIQLLFEHIIKDLVETELLESCEFHEGLDNILPASSVVELLIGAFPDEPLKLGEVFSKLYSGGSLRPSEEEWRLIRANMSAVDFRKMLVSVVEMSCDRIHNVSRLLTDVFASDEQFELADTLRILLERNFILDILPSKRKAARSVLVECFVKPFPFTRKVVSDFCEEALRLEPLEVEANDGHVSEKSVSSSSDSDIESRGSLDDFVVESDEDDEDEYSSSSDESEDSASSGSESPSDRKRKKRTRKPSVSSLSEESYDYPQSRRSRKKSKKKQVSESESSDSSIAVKKKKKNRRS